LASNRLYTPKANSPTASSVAVVVHHIVLESAEGNHNDQSQSGYDTRQGNIANTAGHADRSRYPDGRAGGNALNTAPALNNAASAEKTDAARRRINMSSRGILLSNTINL